MPPAALMWQATSCSSVISKPWILVEGWFNSGFGVENPTCRCMFVTHRILHGAVPSICGSQRLVCLVFILTFKFSVWIYPTAFKNVHTRFDRRFSKAEKGLNSLTANWKTCWKFRLRDWEQNNQVGLFLKYLGQADCASIVGKVSNGRLTMKLDLTNFWSIWRKVSFRQRL